MWGRIVSSVSSVLDINQATLSGCIDIIVVPQADGTFQSTPFHVRFGKAKLLKSREKVVSINVNGKDIDLKMKLGAAGEAYFVEKIDLLDDNCNSSASSIESPVIFPRDIDAPTPPHHSYTCKEQIASSQGMYNPSILKNKKVIFSSSYRNESNAEESDSILFLRTGEELGEQFHNGASISFSLCGHLLYGTYDDQIHDNDVFQANLINSEQFQSDINIWYHPCLVARLNNKPPYYPIKAFYPILASLCAYGKPLSPTALQKFIGIMDYSQYKLPLASNRINLKDHEDYSNYIGPSKSDEYPSLEYTPLSNQQVGHCLSSPASLMQYDDVTNSDGSLIGSSVSACLSLYEQSSVPSRARHSLRPTSDQLRAMGLHWGANRITYSVESSLQGKKTVSGTIYLWPPNTKIVISDVDGTITRSDVLGQLMPIVGRDWSHQGVAELLTKIEENGYKIIYLTARAIGQADATRDFLFGLKQTGDRGHSTLPDGPVFLSPDRLFPSFKREVIDRTPYIFKIAALRDIRNLFPIYRNPLYAGFGNRDTDYRAYSHVGVPEGKIFIIDTKGTLHHINRTYTKTYETMTEIVEYMFPPIKCLKLGALRDSSDNCQSTISDKYFIPTKDVPVHTLESTIFECPCDNELDVMDDQVRRNYKLLTHTAFEGGFDWLICACSLKSNSTFNEDQIVVK
ncbi:lipin family protein [Cryptosporidium muris RN66]|uniref:phosphatidate phosphatase n=1 Tax=Cryptosporidium muris (strain RN66) TaxID=441375 RepID=B6AG00_CRYMR|nr:lipin family protein [Cryptosporidium muris RN66]EEA07141.1 lipin family protein [Cryptosporidium muris RN66]|eukprot:XP_002141490.1 lipin family protein [Cryptosporidium muris RN66]